MDHPSPTLRQSFHFGNGPSSFDKHPNPSALYPNVSRKICALSAATTLDFPPRASACDHRASLTPTTLFEHSTSVKSFPARLHVLLARDAKSAVVIRRGPSKSTAVIGWDRTTDQFQLGQWVRARIYERRCDLSPDGKWFIYFAMNGRWNADTGGAWTAISLAPYVKALSLYAKGDCWQGGGLFTRPKKFWLNGGHTVVREDRRLRRDTDFAPKEHYGAECTGVYYVRLQRDGWTLLSRDRQERLKAHAVFEKPATCGWTLRKIAHEEVGAPPGKGCYWDEHELISSKTGAHISGANWEWADLDGKRLIWATAGQLSAAFLNAEGLKDEQTLRDFNPMKFEPLEAPY